MDERSYDYRNFIGGFTGAFVGILLFAFIHPYAGGIGAALGAVLGFFYDRVWTHIWNWVHSFNEINADDEFLAEVTTRDRVGIAIGPLVAISIFFLTNITVTILYSPHLHGIDFINPLTVSMFVLSACCCAAALFISLVGLNPGEGPVRRARRLAKIRELGFIRYSVGFLVRMFAVEFSMVPLLVGAAVTMFIMVVCLALFFALAGIWLAVFMPMGIIARKTPWIPVVTATAVTMIVGYSFIDQLTTWMVWPLALFGGLTAGVVNVGLGYAARWAKGTSKTFAALISTRTPSGLFVVLGNVFGLADKHILGNLSWPHSLIDKEPNCGL